MTDPPNGETLIKAIVDDIRVATETHCRRVVDDEYKLAEDALQAGLDTLRRQFTDRMATTSAAISAAAPNNDYVERLRHDMLSPEAVMKGFVRCLANHYPSNTPSVTLDNDVIEIPSDTDEDDCGAGGNAETEPVIQDAGEDDGQDAEPGNGQDVEEDVEQDVEQDAEAETDSRENAKDGSGQHTDTDTASSTATRRATQAKRPAAPDSQDLAPPSRPKRARRSCYRSHRVYDLPDSDSEDLRSPTGFRAVRADDIQEKEYAFEYPTVGPGFFVIRCGQGNNTSIFVDDPLCDRFAIEHFEEQGWKCHKKRSQTYTEEQLVRNFGFTVIDSDGDDVDEDWVATSNSKLAKRLYREEAMEEARKSKANGKQRAPRPPPPPRLSPAHRATPPLEVYVAHESATANSAGSKTARPSLSTGTPDQPAGVGNANLNQQQVEGQDAVMVQKTNKPMYPRPSHPPHTYPWQV